METHPAADGAGFSGGGRSSGGQQRQQLHPLLVPSRPLTAVSGAGFNGSSISESSSAAQQRERQQQPDRAKPPPNIPAAPTSALSSAASTATEVNPASSFATPPPPLAPREHAGPEDVAKDMERRVHALLEESARAAAAGDWPLALERAKEASRRERAVTRHREAHGLVEHVNAELGYAVAVNLAAAYQGHGMLDEALQAYQVLVRNKALHPQAGAAWAGGWLRVDMGNVCYAQGKYAQAVKMYRMALDQVPNAHKETRLKIYRNVGHAFVRLGRFHEAIQAYEMVVMNPCIHPQPPPLPFTPLLAADTAAASAAAAGSRGTGMGGGNPWGAAAAAAGEGGGTGMTPSPPPPTTVGGLSSIGQPHSGGGATTTNNNQSISLSFQQHQALLAAAAASPAAAASSEAAVCVLGDYFATALDLILCYYALGDAERMRRGLLRMVAAFPPAALAEEEDEEDDDEEDGPSSSLPSAAAADDALRAELRRRRAEGRRCILTAARLVAPVLDAGDWSAGYTWLVEALRRANHEGLASEVELERGLAYLRNGQLEDGVQVLRAFEKKDKRARRLAATTLSFLHALEGNGGVAERFARLALGVEGEGEGTGRARRRGKGQGQAAALVNLANSLVMQAEEGEDDVEEGRQRRREEALLAAKGLYEEALLQDGDCLEAGFNLGLVCTWLGRWDEAKRAYEGVHARVPQSLEAMYQLGHIAEEQGQTAQAIRWFELLRAAMSSSSSSSPATAAGAAAPMAATAEATPATDADVLTRLGRLYDQQGDEQAARRSFLASDAADPSQLEVLSWLGGWHAGREEYDAAIGHFARAEALASGEARWPLLQAGCRRRAGDFVGALAGYEAVHRRFPEDAECLRCLVQLCRDLGRPCDGYRQALERVERRAGGLGRGRQGQKEQGLASLSVGRQGAVDDEFGDAAVVLP